MSIFRKKGESTIQNRKKKDMIFYCMLLALPILQFIVMWFGVNINSILLSLKEYDLTGNVSWTLNKRL